MTEAEAYKLHMERMGEADIRNPSAKSIDALVGSLIRELATTGNLTIHATRNGLTGVDTPAVGHHRKPLLSALVGAYWDGRPIPERAQEAPSP